MEVRRLAPTLLAAFSLALPVASGAQSELTARQAMTLHSIVGGLQGTMRGLQALYLIDEGEMLPWSVAYTESGATLTASGLLDGVPVSLTGTGTLTGVAGADIGWAATWAGTYGAEPLTGTDAAVWHWDAALGAYGSMDRTFDGRVGAASDTWIDTGASLLFNLFNRLKLPGWEHDPKYGPDHNLTREELDQMREVIRRGGRLVPPGTPCHRLTAVGVKGSYDYASAGCGDNSSGEFDGGNGVGASTVTPEPATGLLLAGGLAATLLVRARRPRRHARIRR